MPHEAAKLLLKQADTCRARKDAVRAAIGLGMPLYEIEAYLDWLDTLRPPPHGDGSLGNGRTRDPDTGSRS